MIEETLSLTLSTDTIIPVRACSPVGSTQVNFDPKSLKTELRSSQPELLINTVTVRARISREYQQR